MSSESKILFFSSSTCNPCNQVKRNLSDDIVEELNIEFLSAEDDFEKFVDHQVQAVPTFVKLVNGKESTRTSGFKTVTDLRNL